MLASGFKAAFDERGTYEASNRSDVRNRTFRLDRSVAVRTSEMSIRAAEPVVTIQEELRLDTRRGDSTVRDGMVDAIDGVPAELCCQRALRLDRPRKHHQAARILVEAVNHAELRVSATSAHPSQQCSSVVDERVLVPGLVGDAEHPDRLVNDDDVAVVKHDRALGKRTGTELGCALVDENDRTGRDTR